MAGFRGDVYIGGCGVVHKIRYVLGNVELVLVFEPAGSNRSVLEQATKRSEKFAKLTELIGIGRLDLSAKWVGWVNFYLMY